MSWENKIIEYGEKPASEFVANPDNFREHPKAQKMAVTASLDENGWVLPVCQNVRTGHLLDGHERIEQALENGNASVPYVLVDVAEEDEGKIIASLDPIAAMAKINKEKLEHVLENARAQNESMQDYLDNLAKRSGLNISDAYSRKVEAPIYTPKGAKPELKDLYDNSKVDRLVSLIDAADIPQGVRDFLVFAAQRHRVFNYRLIADYYAHAEEEIKSLMEDSALVIVDFDKAIEFGYVKLAEAIADQYLNEHGNE